MRGILLIVVYFNVCVCSIYLIGLMSTTDLMDKAATSESIAMDNEQGQSVDDQKEEQVQKEPDQEYQFDVIVIGSGPGGGYVHL
jgi:hypothetical protein